jgi:chemosensory pili system protein ChpA (sensor histidine kinase/response regulator)
MSESPSHAASAIDEEILEVFLEEAQGELVNIRENLLAWRNDFTNQDTLLAMRRSFHTLKGSGRMVEQFTIGDFAWCLENLLNHIRDSKLAPSLAIAEVVDEAHGVLDRLVNETNDGDETQVLAAVEKRVDDLLGNAQVESQPSCAATDTTTIGNELEIGLEDNIDLSEQSQTSPSTEPEPVVIQTTSIETGDPIQGSTSGDSPAVEVDPELVEIFKYEASEILDASDDILERWKQDQENNALLNDLRREMHTLKGSARMTGFMAIGDLAHASEPILDQIATHHVDDLPKLLAALQKSLDGLNTMLASVRLGQNPVPAEALISELRALASEQPAQGAKNKIAGKQEGSRTVQLNSVEQLTELDQELVDVFQYEAAEILDASDVTLQRWSAEQDNSSLLNDLRREMHTLKGSARMTGFMAIGDLAHASESLLDAISKGGLQPSAPVLQTLQRALDGLNDMVGKIQIGVQLAPAEDLINDIKSLLGESPKGQALSSAHKQVEKKPVVVPGHTPVNEDTVRVSAALLNRLVNEMGESSIYRARVDQKLGSVRFNLSELNQTVYRLRQQLRRLEIETETQILFRYEDGDKNSAKDFDPLELDRFSEMQQLSRSLMEIVDDLGNIQNTLGDQAQDMGTLLEQQAKTNKEVQQGLMRTRMVRFSTVAPRLRRVVRQAAQELGKQAELELQGAESEMDRTVLENMVAPLEHMLRNAVSHGIEMPEERLALGKPEQGTINLSMRREGAELVMILEDGGAGLDFDAIRVKAEANGMLLPGQQVSEDDLITLLLRPGFSTAKKVTQISGRGVGLDVLNEAIKAMRGTLLIKSKRGQGTKFTIRLPFSLAVTQALLVQAGRDTYAIPLLSIESVSRLDEGELKTYLDGNLVEHRYGDHRYPVHNLGVLFGVNEPTAYEKIPDKRPPIMLFRSAEASAALQVEAVHGNQEIIVKPVGPQFQSLPGISGAAVLGDGRVVVVLELAAVVRNLTSQNHKQQEAQTLYAVRRETKRQQIKAMVIDDSITMRKVTGRLLERLNMEVTTAKDGLEAVTKLEEQIPDLVILDIEMPRMDGFEVAAHIRNQAQLRHIPIIMVTSRGGEKHRNRAAKIGVNEYLTKPYQEEEMIKSVRNLLGLRTQELSI